jgi:adenylate cyclase
VSVGRRLAAVMFTDVVGYSSLAQSDEQRALRLLEEKQEILRPVLEKYHGREVKSTGDGFLMEFESARDAALCAVEVQERIRERNRAPAVTPLQVRIGIHVGDVERRGSDILGDTVNIAARIEPAAEPGGVCLSPQVYDQIKNKVDFDLERLGPRVLKGIREPLELYRIVMPSDVIAGAAPPESIARLAVLPLANISPDPNDAYLADGLTEELIAVLSQLRGLRVIARTSVVQYRTTTKPISSVGRELGVSSVLEGSVRKAGDRLRITLQLIDVASEEHTWAESFNRHLDDVFQVQAEIAEHTARALRLQLLPAEREAIHRPPTPNLEAYHLYLQGLHSFQDLQFGRGEQMLESAIRADPEFVAALASLANLLIGAYGETEPRSAIEKRVEELVRRALDLDPSSSTAHAARGNLAFQLENDWSTAEREFQRAIELNPSDSQAYFWYGLMCIALQRYDTARDQLRNFSLLDPGNPNGYGLMAEACALAGDYSAAIEAAMHCVGKRSEGHADLAQIYEEWGRDDDARREAILAFDTLKAKGPLTPGDEWYIATRRARLFGFPEEARALLNKWESSSAGPGGPTPYVPRRFPAGLHIVLGEYDRALAILEEDYYSGDRTLWFYYQRPFLDPVRNDPRFVALLRASNLPTATPWHRSRIEPSHSEV